METTSFWLPEAPNTIRPVGTPSTTTNGATVAMSTPARQQARILIIDDEPSNVVLLERLLRRVHYENVVSFTDPGEGLVEYAREAPDVLLLDLHMPHIDGFTVLERLAPQREGDYRPTLVLTADANPDTKRRALAAGANDFLTKPFDAIEVMLRIGNLLETRLLHLEVQRHNKLLEQRVQERTAALEEARLEILSRLALAAEYRDDNTHRHTQRVGEAAARLGRIAGMSDEEVPVLRQAAPLHDVGKIGIPDDVLLKPGGLTDENFATMKEHTVIGARIVGGSRFPTLQMAEEIALTHHENWDGTGYPAGLEGERIPLSGRIVSVVDVFDALTHDRPYKKAWSVAEATAAMEQLRGTKFDPYLLDLFLGHLQAEG